ncbi:MAG TPA: methyltransferase domain-containing protein [Terriglobales bacterium]|nr:methyltransferase domain-containing protein [Terriglobales bacterium]
MSHRVCPWWLGYFLASPIRRWMTDPGKLLAPYVREGMTVLEPGPGMGFFTLELARLAGPTGRVIAVDVQERMLSALRKKARKAGLLSRIDARLVPPDSMGMNDLAGSVDFTLAYAVVHEIPSCERFFQEAATASRNGAQLLLVEPAGHVRDADFDEELRLAGQAGFAVMARPSIPRSHAAVLKKE